MSTPSIAAYQRQKRNGCNIPSNSPNPHSEKNLKILTNDIPPLQAEVEPTTYAAQTAGLGSGTPTLIWRVGDIFMRSCMCPSHALSSDCRTLLCLGKYFL